MNLYIILFLIVIQNVCPRTTDVTLGVHERVKLLKHQIVKEIQASQDFFTPIVDDFTDHEYVEMDNQPITPISNDDERKKKNKFKLRQLKTTTKKEGKATLRAMKNKVRKVKKRTHKKMTSRATDIFYRRQHYNTDMMDTAIEWAHCQDLITPFLTEQKTNISHAKKVTVKDGVVVRLAQLLTMNTTGLTKDDIYSIMYQISNLQIRLFQWDVTAVKFLFKNVVKNTRKHSFGALKHTLKEIFKSWSLDITNTTNLLKQSRIFRPPCVEITGYEGSTKTSLPTPFYTKTKKKKCIYDDGDDECTDP